MPLDRSSALAGTSRPATLVCTPGAIWLWPGTKLTERRGGRIVPLPRSSLLAAACILHGPAANQSALVESVEHAAVVLDQGSCLRAQAILNRSGLSLLSQDGCDLAGMIAKRLGLAAPSFLVSTGPRLWTAAHVDRISRYYDDRYRLATSLAPIFARGGWDPNKHPRWSGGDPDHHGGYFSPKDEGSPDDAHLVPVSATDQGPGIGHNSGDLPEEPPEVPHEPPSSPEVRTAVQRAVAGWLARRVAILGLAALRNPIVLGVVSAIGIGWLAVHRDRILASLTPPRTLEQLQDAVNHPQRGTEIHHIVEAQKESINPLSNTRMFGPRIESRENKVRIPYWAHRDISDWYSTGNREFGGRTPRDALRGKSWQEQYEAGLDALRDAGVLK